MNKKRKTDRQLKAIKKDCFSYSASTSNSDMFDPFYYDEGIYNNNDEIKEIIKAYIIIKFYNNLNEYEMVFLEDYNWLQFKKAKTLFEEYGSGFFEFIDCRINADIIEGFYRLYMQTEHFPSEDCLGEGCEKSVVEFVGTDKYREYELENWEQEVDEFGQAIVERELFGL